jgi:hypothetical protein
MARITHDFMSWLRVTSELAEETRFAVPTWRSVLSALSSGAEAADEDAVTVAEPTVEILEEHPAAAAETVAEFEVVAKAVVTAAAALRPEAVAVELAMPARCAFTAVLLDTSARTVPRRSYSSRRGVSDVVALGTPRRTASPRRMSTARSSRL